MGSALLNCQRRRVVRHGVSFLLLPSTPPTRAPDPPPPKSWSAIAGWTFMCCISTRSPLGVLRIQLHWRLPRGNCVERLQAAANRIGVPAPCQCVRRWFLRRLTCLSLHLRIWPTILTLRRKVCTNRRLHEQVLPFPAPVAVSSGRESCCSCDSGFPRCEWVQICALRPPRRSRPYQFRSGASGRVLGFCLEPFCN